MTMTESNCSFISIWKGKIQEKFNSLCIGQIFRDGQLTIVVGCEDGVVRIYTAPKAGQQLKQCCQKLETKGGPIQTLVIHDITRFYSNDVVVGDSRGMLTMFCNQQILARQCVSQHCINCLLVQQNTAGSIMIICGDSEGHISATSPYMDLWRIRLADVNQVKNLSVKVVVKSMLAVRLPNTRGHMTDYILASDNTCHLYFIQQGSIVMVLNTPAVINAMCSGNFVASESLEDATSINLNNSHVSSANKQQVALGSENGTVFILDNYQIYYDEFADVQLPISHMQTLTAADSQQYDTILCAGHFNALCVLRNGKVIGRYSTSDWINSIVTADIDGDGATEVIVGCLDKTIQGLKLTFS